AAAHQRRQILSDGAERQRDQPGMLKILALHLFQAGLCLLHDGCPSFVASFGFQAISLPPLLGFFRPNVPRGRRSLYPWQTARSWTRRHVKKAPKRGEIVLFPHETSIGAAAR